MEIKNYCVFCRINSLYIPSFHASSVNEVTEIETSTGRKSSGRPRNAELEVKGIARESLIDSKKLILAPFHIKLS